MSGGDSPVVFPHLQQQEDKEGATDPNSPHPMSENLQGEGNLDGDDDDDDDDQKEQLEEIKNDEETDNATVSSRESEKQIAEDDDGFKTPTSSDHRIPATTQCPPAPKKPRPQTSKLKRKASPPPGARRSLQFDAATEVESIFRQIPDQDNIEEQKIKKARREDDEESS
ncbi:UNVERIFIED_CONTAM: Cyclin-dependent protein kinase inhibitor SMR3 [Sesamum calycinum]|uniref:Cyclin-dependent protein kinase inhibitor SMR3 n=1 Tax=Sesamum calycinum TaxID=2727403 RepID=A0AAW2NWJ9_9LAMI